MRVKRMGLTEKGPQSCRGHCCSHLPHFQWQDAHTRCYGAPGVQEARAACCTETPTGCPSKPQLQQKKDQKKVRRRVCGWERPRRGT
ncbi:Uncharacterised protein [Chlamydia abortus]|nr:Uncharacterised protein [Chlamydia abortus]